MKKAVYLFIITLLSIQGYAQQKNIQRFSLQEAIDFAKKNNISLQNGELDVKKAEKQVQEIMSLGLPNINAGANFQNNVQIPVQRLPNFINDALPPGSPKGPDYINAQFGLPYTTSANISASQLLFDGGFLMGVKASKEFVNMSRVNLKRNNIETEVNVSTSYYLALSVEANLKLIEKNLETLKKTRDDFEATYKVGLMEKLNYDRATLQYNNLNLSLLRAKDNYVISLLVLKLQMGMDLNDSIVLTDNLQDMYTNNKFVLPETKVDYTKRTEIQILDQSIVMNGLDKKRYQYGYAPTLSAYATHQQNTFGQNFSDLGGTWFPGTYWGLNLSVPIFNGMRKSSKIQQATIEMEKAENQKSLMMMQIDREVLSAKQVYLRASEQIELQRANLLLAEEVYKSTQSRSQSGVGSSLDLTTSINDLEVARINFINTVYDFFKAQLEYRRAMGLIN
jgi:outer membrane protein TolC